MRIEVSNLVIIFKPIKHTDRFLENRLSSLPEAFLQLDS